MLTSVTCLNRFITQTEHQVEWIIKGKSLYKVMKLFKSRSISRQDCSACRHLRKSNGLDCAITVILCSMWSLFIENSCIHVTGLMVEWDGWELNITEKFLTYS